jgi:hypothetical protein
LKKNISDAFSEWSASRALGVAQNKKSLPPVWGPDIRSRDNARRNSESEALKVARDHPEGMLDCPPDVFPPNPRNVCLGSDAKLLGPER